MSLRISTIVFLLSLPNLNAQPAQVMAEPLDFFKVNYTKYQIPMRDGKKLITAVYAPKDTAQRYPIPITRTPLLIARQPSHSGLGANRLPFHAVVRTGANVLMFLHACARPFDHYSIGLFAPT